MAKINYYEVRCMRFPKIENGVEVAGAEPVTVDNVILEISKKVNRPGMKGDKTERYSVPLADVPRLFGKNDVRLPSIDGNHVTGWDCSKRIEAACKFLDSYVGKDCYAEEITVKDRKVLTYIEVNE